MRIQDRNFLKIVQRINTRPPGYSDGRYHEAKIRFSIMPVQVVNGRRRLVKDALGQLSHNNTYWGDDAFEQYLFDVMHRRPINPPKPKQPAPPKQAVRIKKKEVYQYRAEKNTASRWHQIFVDNRYITTVPAQTSKAQILAIILAHQ